MLEEQHNRVKKFISTYYKIWLCEFIPECRWEILNKARNVIYPINLTFGIYCMLWHFFFQMNDYGYDLALTVIYFFGSYQCYMVYFEIMIIRREKIFGMLEFFDGFITSTEAWISDIRKKHLLVNTRLGLQWTRIFLLFITFVGVSVTVFHMFITNYTAPMLFIIPGIPEDSWFFYPVNIIYGIFLYFSILIYITAADAVVMIMVLYFRSEFNSLSELSSQMDDPVMAKKLGPYILKTLYKNHNVALVKIKELTQSFWHLYFHKLFAMMIYLCCTLYIFQSLTSTIFVAVLIVGAMTSQIFILCFFGQVIKNSSEGFYEAFYLTKWYEMNLSEQKTYLIMLMNLQKDVTIETFGFGSISIYTFVQICKAAGTYAAVLYTVLN
ncbi:hypothetical protein DMENIID0001_096330 [Sergentomyia squamirostris]